MKSILALALVALVGCSTPNPAPHATNAAYEQLKPGLTREQVYALLGPPQMTKPAGDAAHCRSATWKIPNDSHGWGHWTVHFDADTISEVSTTHATFTKSN